jgi:transcriptional regulator with XRE-family HTH domain
LGDSTKTRYLTKEEIARCQKYYGLGLTIADMAAIIGISKASFERRMNDQPELREGLLKGAADAAGAVMNSLFKQATSGKNTAATIFWLKCRKGWKEPAVSEHDDPQYKPPESLVDDPKKE